MAIAGWYQRRENASRRRGGEKALRVVSNGVTLASSLVAAQARAASAFSSLNNSIDRHVPWRACCWRGDINDHIVHTHAFIRHAVCACGISPRLPLLYLVVTVWRHIVNFGPRCACIFCSAVLHTRSFRIAAAAHAYRHSLRLARCAAQTVEKKTQRISRAWLRALVALFCIRRCTRSRCISKKKHAHRAQSGMRATALRHSAASPLRRGRLRG